MRRKRLGTTILRLAACGALLAALAPAVATATEPCDDFGECTVLIEINATDGDIGFQFLMDGDDLLQGRIDDPNGVKVFQEAAKGPLAEQFLTETFAESAEPLCWPDPEADPEDEIVTLEEFLELWTPGTYSFRGRGEEGEMSFGESELTFQLPAAPQDIDFAGGVISWRAGDDLGNCATAAELDDLVTEGILPVHPENVRVDHWEVVLEPDVDDGDPVGDDVFSIRLPGASPLQVTVPADYLAALPDDTLVKIEVGAIGGEDNATFSEEDGFCVNEVEGCED
jgi:hypothetical protein